MNHDKVYGVILNKSIEKILTWSFAKDHPLEKCGAEVKKIIQESANLAKQGRYEEAIESLEEATEKDPSYVGSRVRTMKYLIETDQPFQALLVAGGVLVLSDDEKPRSQVWDMASGIAFDFFINTNNIFHAEEAEAFANEATKLSPDDIVCAWNRLNILLAIYKFYKKNDNKEDAGRYMSLSKKACDHILDFAKNNSGNTVIYWLRILEDAKNIFPNLEWWDNKAKEMQEIDITLNDEVQPPPSTQGDYLPGIIEFTRAALRIAAMLALLIWPVLGSAIFATNNTDLLEIPKTPESRIEKTDTKNKGTAESQLKKVSYEIVGIERDVSELAAIKRDTSEFSELAYRSEQVTSLILNDLQKRLTQIKRDDSDLA
ncbi:MAG: hypothetical protein ACL93V_05430 [Candidatus Electrothrix sp. YB6]